MTGRRSRSPPVDRPRRTRCLDPRPGSLPHSMSTLGLVGAAFRAIAGAGGRPVLFHCSAGKDRTGWLSAVLLELLGIDRSVIVKDYLATNGYAHAVHLAIMDAMRARGLAVNPDT